MRSDAAVDDGGVSPTLRVKKESVVVGLKISRRVQVKLGLAEKMVRLF